MNRLRLALLPILAGALFATSSAQPAPPAPPAPPRAPKAPKAPKPPRAPAPDPWSSDFSEQVKDQIRDSLGDSIDEIESDDSIPPAVKQRILKQLRKAQKSGDPRDLAELGSVGADLGAAISAEVEKELRKAGITGGFGPHGSGVNIDLGRLQGDLERLRALQHRHDDDDEADDVDAEDTSDWDVDGSGDWDSSGDVDQADLDRARARMERDRARLERDRARLERERDSWAPFSDEDGSPFDGDLGWMENIPFAPSALPPGAMPPSAMRPMPDVHVDLNLDLDDLRLDSGKLAELDRIASDEQAATAGAEGEVKRLGRQLQVVVGGANPNEAEIGRLVDAITTQEAVIRKARLTALIRTRKLLGQ